MRERVVVVIVTFNSARVLPGLLDSLPLGLEGADWSLVVADNDSADETVALVHRLAPGATVVEMGRNAGYAAGINAAVRAAGDFGAVLVLNPDVRLAPGCVRELLGVLDATGAGICVPRLEDSRGELILSMRREPTLLRAYADALLGAGRAGRVGALGEVVSDPGRYDVPGSPDWAEGSTQLIGAACWRACEGWDETFFLYSEETDYHLRARDRGFAVRYVPTARAVHLEGASASSPRLWSLLVANRLRLFRRRHTPAGAALFWLASLLREGSRSVLGHAIARSAVRVLVRPSLLAAPRGPEWLERV
ncbi:glycosyltransferase family 2 protein [Nocardioides conyzicola]|uniref:Glycosyltransferase family 2 protein n=1 Tax=Nocardioides conyzicola TaxID=1651781 RepID=A0ABP8XLS6_9ACTN